MTRKGFFCSAQHHTGNLDFPTNLSSVCIADIAGKKGYARQWLGFGECLTCSCTKLCSVYIHAGKAHAQSCALAFFSGLEMAGARCLHKVVALDSPLFLVLVLTEKFLFPAACMVNITDSPISMLFASHPHPDKGVTHCMRLILHLKGKSQSCLE